MSSVAVVPTLAMMTWPTLPSESLSWFVSLVVMIERQLPVLISVPARLDDLSVAAAMRWRSSHDAKEPPVGDRGLLVGGGRVLPLGVPLLLGVGLRLGRRGGVLLLRRHGGAVGGLRVRVALRCLRRLDGRLRVE